MRTYAQALAWVKGQVAHPSQDWTNLCQGFSRQAFGAAAWAPSAREAFNATPSAHRHTSWPPPAGSIAYWGNAHAGAGHATPVLDTLYSTDIFRHGKVDPVKLTRSASDMPFVTKWGLPYRGWIDATPSGEIPTPPRPANPPAPYPGKPIGWPAASTVSKGPAIVTLERCFGLPETGVYSLALRNRIAGYQNGHAWAWARDRVGRGAAGPNLYAGIVRQYYPA